MLSFLALAGSALAYNATATVESTKWVTIPCSTPTTLTYGSSTYTITKATTLTVEDCSCTHNSQIVPQATSSKAPVLVNGANAGKVGAAAGAAAVAAYFL